MTVTQLRNFLNSIKNTYKNPTDYTKGYIDALRYIVEWMEEDEDRGEDR